MTWPGWDCLRLFRLGWEEAECMRNRGYHKAGMGCIIDENNEILGKCRKPLRECPALVLCSPLVCFEAVSFRLDSSQRLQESEGELLPAPGCSQVKRHLVLSQKCRQNLSISCEEREREKRLFLPASVSLAPFLKCCSRSFQDTFDSKSIQVLNTSSEGGALLFWS